MNNSVGLIGVSTAETGRPSIFYASLIGLSKPSNSYFVMARGSEISKNRNIITEEMLKRSCEWVLYLDDDQVLVPNTLQRLLEADKDVISAHYTRRQYPFDPVLLDYEYPDGKMLLKHLDSSERGLIKVAAAGAGCLLVKRKVIEALEPPYWTLGQINPASWGDDLHFCSRVRKAGFDVWCDLDNCIGHVMQGVVWPAWDEKRGWVAEFAQDPTKGPIAGWPMPLPGEPVLVGS